MAEHHVVLLGVRRRCISAGVAQCGGEARAVHGTDAHTLTVLRDAETEQVDERGQQIGRVLILEAHVTGRLDAGSGDDERHRVPTGERVLLVEAPRRAGVPMPHPRG